MNIYYTIDNKCKNDRGTLGIFDTMSDAIKSAHTRFNERTDDIVILKWESQKEPLPSKQLEEYEYVNNEWVIVNELIY